MVGCVRYYILYKDFLKIFTGLVHFGVLEHSVTNGKWAFISIM